MKSLRILSGLALTLILAFALSACQKSQTDMSQTSDTTQVSQGYGNETPAPAAAPEAQSAMPSKSSMRTHTSTHKTRESSNAPETHANYAEKHMIDIPAGIGMTGMAEGSRLRLGEPKRLVGHDAPGQALRIQGIEQWCDGGVNPCLLQHPCFVKAIELVAQGLVARFAGRDRKGGG